MSNADRQAEIQYNEFARGRCRFTGTGGFLAKLWSNIVGDLGITYNAMELKSATFMRNAKPGNIEANKQGYFNRGNLRREIIKPTMTFKVFVKVLRVINVKNVRLAIELTFHDNTKSLHQIDIEPSTISIIDEEDFQTDQDYTDFIKGSNVGQSAGAKLSRFWASILMDREVSPVQFDDYCLKFVNKAKKDLEYSVQSSYFSKSNLRRELTKQTMTFKVFIKGLRVIGVKSFKLVTDLTFTTGRKSLHQIEVDLSAQSSLDDGVD